jgi:hypothetical protein
MLPESPAETTWESIPGGSITEARSDWLLPGTRASAGRLWSKSFTSVISSIGVMPQMASGEKTLSRSATAPTSLPSI